MKGLASFCLFGKDSQSIYWPGAEENARMYLEHFPEIDLRFYVGVTGYEAIAAKLDHHPNVISVVKMDEPEDQTATYWRFRALKDVTLKYDFFIFRDADSRPIKRERVAVKEWLQSDKDFHVIRDHPFHSVPILAGLFRVKSGPAMTSLSRMLPDRVTQDFYQVDQKMLETIAWPIAKKSLMQHVDCKWDFGLPKRRLTGSWRDEGFCGQGFYGNGTPRFVEHSRERVG